MLAALKTSLQNAVTTRDSSRLAEADSLRDSFHRQAEQTLKRNPDDAGTIASVARLGAGGGAGVDIDPGIWHTVVVLSDSAVCFEVKPGPWDAATDKEFAPWAPPEGDAAGVEYVEALVRESLER